MTAVLADQATDFICYRYGFRRLLQEVMGFKVVTSAIESALMLVIDQPDDGVRMISRLKCCGHLHLLTMGVTKREL